MSSILTLWWSSDSGCGGYSTKLCSVHCHGTVHFPLHLSFQCFGTFIKLMGHCSRILDSEQISSKSEIMIFLAGRKVNFEPCRVSSALSICFKFSIISIMSTWRKNDNYFWCEITQRNRVKINKTMQLCADKKKKCAKGNFCLVTPALKQPFQLVVNALQLQQFSNHIYLFFSSSFYLVIQK